MGKRRGWGWDKQHGRTGDTAQLFHPVEDIEASKQDLKEVS